MLTIAIPSRTSPSAHFSAAASGKRVKGAPLPIMYISGYLRSRHRKCSQTQPDDNRRAIYGASAAACKPYHFLLHPGIHARPRRAHKHTRADAHETQT
jgi:hypothetical protein